MADQSNSSPKPAALQVVIPLDSLLHVDLMAAAAAAGTSAAEHAKVLLIKGLREPDAPDIGEAVDRAAEALEAHILGASEQIGTIRGLAQRRAQAMAKEAAGAAATGGLPAVPQDGPCPVTGHGGPNGAAAPGGGVATKAGAAAPTASPKPHVSGRPVPASRADVRARYRF